MQFNSGKRGISKYIAVLTALTLITGAVSALSLGEGFASPANPSPGSTVSNQQVTFTAQGVSADGDTDTFYVEFDNRLNSSLSVNGVSVDNASVSSSPELVEGYDNDTVEETVVFAVSPTGGDTVDLNITVDVSVSYPNKSAEHVVETKIVDSQFGATSSQVATISVGDTTEGSSSGSGDSTDSSSGSTDSTDSSSDTDSTSGSTDSTSDDTSSSTNGSSGSTSDSTSSDSGESTSNRSSNSTGSQPDRSQSQPDQGTSGEGAEQRKQSQIERSSENKPENTGKGGVFKAVPDLEVINNFLEGLF